MSLVDRFVFVVLLATGAAAAAEPQQNAQDQERIAAAVAAVVRQDDGAKEAIETLADSGRARRAALLLQLSLYLERATGTEQAMAGALVLNQLAFTPAEKLDAVEPHLLSAGPALRRVFTELLATIDRPDGGAPDFRVYEARIRGKTPPPAGLILYLYEVSPDAALASMERVYGGERAPGGRPSRGDIELLRKVLPSSEVSPELSGDELVWARAAVDAIAQDPAWWRRLYAAAVLREQPSLATPEITARLQRDSHPLVRQAAGR